MIAPPQGVGISKGALDEALKKAERRTLKWQIISLALGITSIIEGILLALL